MSKCKTVQDENKIGSLAVLKKDGESPVTKQTLQSVPSSDDPSGKTTE